MFLFFSPGAVGHLDADAVAVLASALGGGVIAGSRPTQAGSGGAATAAIAVGAHGPAGPGSEAPVHRHVSDLHAAGKRKALQGNGLSRKNPCHCIRAMRSGRCFAYGKSSPDRRCTAGWKRESIFLK